MSASRAPGPLGSDTFNPLPDWGTLALARMPLPGPVGQIISVLAHAAVAPLQPLSAPTLRRGDRGAEVRQLQALLNARCRPSPHLQLDGEFGLATERAVRSFQWQRRLSSDGVVGSYTWLALSQRTALQGVDEAPARTARGAATRSAIATAVKPISAAVTAPASQARWMAIARAEMGQCEVRGAGANPRILEYHGSTSLRAQSDEIAWCSSFVNWVLAQAGIRGTNSAAAASWVQWGREVEASEGAIVVIRNAAAANSSLTTSGNHVGFLIEQTAQHFVLLGGNQGDQVKESRFRRSSWTMRACRWPKTD